MKKMELLLFFPIFTKGIQAKHNELESESDIFLQNEGKVGKSELTPVVKALTNFALVLLFSTVRFHVRPQVSCLIQCTVG